MREEQYPFALVGLIILHKNKILLIKEENSSFDLPKDLIKTGETLKKAARRYLKEKIPIKANIGKFFHLQEKIEKDHQVIFYFLAKPDEKDKINTTLDENFRWVEIEKVNSLPLNHTLSEVISKLPMHYKS